MNNYMVSLEVLRFTAQGLACGGAGFIVFGFGAQLSLGFRACLYLRLSGEGFWVEGSTQWWFKQDWTCSLLLEHTPRCVICAIRTD